MGSSVSTSRKAATVLRTTSSSLTHEDTVKNELDSVSGDELPNLLVYNSLWQARVQPLIVTLSVVRHWQGVARAAPVDEEPDEQQRASMHRQGSTASVIPSTVVPLGSPRSKVYEVQVSETADNEQALAPEQLAIVEKTVGAARCNLRRTQIRK